MFQCPLPPLLCLLASAKLLILSTHSSPDFLSANEEEGRLILDILVQRSFPFPLEPVGDTLEHDTEQESLSASLMEEKRERGSDQN